MTWSPKWSPSRLYGVTGVGSGGPVPGGGPTHGSDQVGGVSHGGHDLGGDHAPGARDEGSVHGYSDRWAIFRHRDGTSRLTVCRFGGGTVGDGLIIVIQSRGSPPRHRPGGIQRRRTAMDGGTASSGPSTVTSCPANLRHLPVGIERQRIAFGGGTARGGPTGVISCH